MTLNGRILVEKHDFWRSALSKVNWRQYWWVLKSAHRTTKMPSTLTLHCRIVLKVSIASNSRWNDFEWSYIGWEKRFLEECFEQSKLEACWWVLKSAHRAPKMTATLTLHCRIVLKVSIASNSRWNDFEWSYIGWEKRFLEECFEQSKLEACWWVLKSAHRTPKIPATLTLHCRMVPRVSIASNSRWTDFEWSYIG
jgi:hypothetical protein